MIKIILWKNLSFLRGEPLCQRLNTCIQKNFPRTKGTQFSVIFRYVKITKAAGRTILCLVKEYHTNTGHIVIQIVQHDRAVSRHDNLPSFMT